MTLGGGIGGQPTVLPGGIVTVAYTISNSGSAKASAGDIGFYISTDSTITTDDTLVVYANAFDAVPADGALPLTTQITLPGALADGTYYIGVIADIGNDVTETNESNNASAGVSFVVAGGSPPVNISSNGGGALASLQIEENSTAVTTVKASGTGVGFAITGGADEALFAINTATGVLRFLSPPDFENPADSGANNVYNVVIQASNGSTSDSQALAVSIGNRGGANIIGTLGNDTISRSASPPGQPTTTAEEDVIYALAGNDTIAAGDGSDTIDGGAGQDRIIGGGGGGDSLKGGRGADIYIYKDVGDSTPASRYVILDFKVGVDKLDLSAIDAIANGGTANDAFTIGGDVVPGVLGLLWSSTVTKVLLNTDSDPQWDAVIILKGLGLSSPSFFDGTDIIV